MIESIEQIETRAATGAIQATETTAATQAGNCLNCRAVLHGEFCHECGQERGSLIVSLNESFFELLNEFTKFDQKLFKSFLYLLVKPGFLTKEYAAGRRAQYLQPLKLYLTINFFCFLLAGWFDPPVMSREDVAETFFGRDVPLEAFNQTFSAILPTLLMLVFPFFAALLKLVYLRSKQFYAFHFIFALHYFSFFMLAVIPTYFSEFYLNWLLLPAAGAYLFAALKVVYGQSWLKTFFKWLIVGVNLFILIGIWASVSMFWSYVTVYLSS